MYVCALCIKRRLSRQPWGRVQYMELIFSFFDTSVGGDFPPFLRPSNPLAQWRVMRAAPDWSTMGPHLMECWVMQICLHHRWESVVMTIPSSLSLSHCLRCNLQLQPLSLNLPVWSSCTSASLRVYVRHGTHFYLSFIITYWIQRSQYVLLMGLQNCWDL